MTVDEQNARTSMYDVLQGRMHLPPFAIWASVPLHNPLCSSLIRGAETILEQKHVPAKLQQKQHNAPTSVYEVPHARMYLQPFTIWPKVALIAGCLAHSLVGAGATLRGFKGPVGKFPLLPCFVMVATG